MDVARGRSRTTGRFVLPNPKDTLVVSLARHAVGNDLAPWLWTAGAPAPWQLGMGEDDQMHAIATVAGWPAPKSAPLERPGDPAGKPTWCGPRGAGVLAIRIDLGVLGGSHRNRPWLQESDSAAQFHGQIGQACGRVRNRPTAPTVGRRSGCRTSPAPSVGPASMGHGVGHSPWPGSRPKLQAQSFRGTLAPRSAHPCCPCGATKRPGKLRPCGAVKAQ